MSQENVEAYERALEVYNRQDVEALLEELDPEIEWYSALLVPLGGEGTVYQEHEGVREGLRDLNEVLGEISEIRDLGDRVITIGRVHARGRESGVETESPFGQLIEFKNGKAIRMRAYLDPKEALKAAGLRE